MDSTYNTWAAMRYRCSPSAKGKLKAAYFDRGIRVCDQWSVYACFLADMGPRPDGTSIDRFPNGDGNYEPGNCRWATLSEQNKNRRPFTHPSQNPLTFRGVTKPVRDWERELGFARNTLHSRIRRSGWDVERALTTPARHKTP